VFCDCVREQVFVAQNKKRRARSAFFGFGFPLQRFWGEAATLLSVSLRVALYCRVFDRIIF